MGPLKQPIHPATQTQLELSSNEFVFSPPQFCTELFHEYRVIICCENWESPHIAGSLLVHLSSFGEHVFHRSGAGNPTRGDLEPAPVTIGQTRKPPILRTFNCNSFRCHTFSEPEVVLPDHLKVGSPGTKL